jgi:hypothetical protein
MVLLMSIQEVKSRGLSIAGFRAGATLAPPYLYKIFGEDKVNGLCGDLMAQDIQEECDKTGLAFVGRGRIIDFRTQSFVPGKHSGSICTVFETMKDVSMINIYNCSTCYCYVAEFVVVVFMPVLYCLIFHTNYTLLFIL